MARIQAMPLLRFLGRQLREARDQPVARLLKPGIKAVVAIAGLSLAAHLASERSLDRQGLARLASQQPAAAKAQKAGKEPAAPSTPRRP